MFSSEIKRYSFSGHDSFQCRNLWLKKGYDFVLNGNSFTNEDAVVTLGVGKNMVSSIKFWMKAFDLLDSNDALTTLSHRLFSDENGWDPYLEDVASLWLLHYHLVKKGYATTYYLILNDFRKEKIEFTKDSFCSYIKRKSESLKTFNFNQNTINADFEVFLKMYLRNSPNDKEDSYAGILTELEIIQSIHSESKEYYIIENTEKQHISNELILYTILDNADTNEFSISLQAIEQHPNNIGSVFAVNRTGIIEKIEKICMEYPEFLTFSNQAGIREVQFKSKPNPLEVLENYYNKVYAN